MPYCNMYQSLTCADVKLANFQSSELYNLYCNCEPKCIRTDYDVLITPSVISKHAAERKLHTLFPPPHNLDKIGRIQDWNYLLEVNRSYTDTLYTISHFMEPTSDKNLLGYLYDVSNQMAIFKSSCFLKKICIKRAIQECENMNSILSDLLIMQDNLINVVRTSFFFVHDEPSDNIIEDINVRCANDILRNNGTHMREFYSQIMTELDLILAVTKQIRNKITYVMNVNDTDVFETNKCDTVDSVTNLTTLSDIESKYDIIESNIKTMYNEYENLRNTIKSDTKLMNSRDWGIFHPEEFYHDNYLEIIIYFESLSTTKISQFETDSLNSLICDLGGNLGLWLGGSLLTLVEIIDLAIIIPIYRKQG